MSGEATTGSEFAPGYVRVSIPTKERCVTQDTVGVDSLEPLRLLPCLMFLLLQEVFKHLNALLAINSISEAGYLAHRIEDNRDNNLRKRLHNNRIYIGITIQS